MHEKRTREEQYIEHDEEMFVLLTLLDQDDCWPWTVEELIRDRAGDDDVTVKDAISQLERGGLIRRTQEGLVFPTRAAIYRAELGE